MSLTHILWSIIVGAVVGLLARALLPGADHIGMALTIVVGIAGSWLGGFLGSLVSKPAEGAKFHPAGFLMSIVGAVVLLLLLRMVR
ncbi:MAG TPA: GlsB/YeaQ/YmgE family stress response membrane protein [Gemmatimonadales bacterium]|jgi:uncharacterized membrane protein YeaQ/YmgE (transglycosylase-associated protein family)|nr:GlsB/YeaQ/YmgE family stress response membrane protein [Gemmatimonadales bacterium]